MDINQPDLFIIRGYIKRRDKNNYKVLFFIIKKAFREKVIEKNYIFITLGKISVVPSKISVAPSEISAVLSKISVFSS